MAAKIFVGNLDFKATREEVQALFAQVGEVRDVFLPSDRETGRPRGFAFVEFTADEDAAKAIERFNGYQLSGRPLRVNAAEERQRTSRPSSPRPSGEARPSGDFSRDFGDFGSDPGRDESFGKTKGSRRNLRARKRSL